VNCSLVEHSKASRSISILRVVQTAMRSNIEGLASGEREILQFLTAEESNPAYWVERAIELVSVAYSSLSSESPAECESLTSNALCCLSFGTQYQIKTFDLAALQCSLARRLFDEEAYEEGCHLFEQALRIQECIYGVDHLNIITTLNNLGITYSMTQRYGQALMLLQRSLYIIRKSLGDNNITIADVLVNLGQTYCAMGKYNDALSHHHAARIIRENDLASDQTKLAEIFGFLGEDYFRLARAEIAIECCRRALAIFESSPQGFKSGRRIHVMETLARSYSSLGIYSEALEIYSCVLDVRHKMFPADHIDTADIIHDMGVALQAMSKFNHAIDAFETALAIYKKTHSGHGIEARIANAIKNLGVVYSQQGEHAKAIEYFNRALRIEQSLGQSNIDSAKTINNMGIACARLGFWGEAMSHYMNALDLVNSLTGCECHVDVADLLYNIGVTSAILGRIHRAKEYLGRSLRIFVACLGYRHSKSLDAMRFLKSLRRRQNTRSRKSRKRLYRHSKRPL
jgi:tetratricopeptide (TPR) repeat protein